jgi:hypothetical protein
MAERTAAELEAMIRDFVGQLSEAKACGLDRAQPARYRALVEAVRLVLRERYGLGRTSEGEAVSRLLETLSALGVAIDAPGGTRRDSGASAPGSS